MSTSKARVKHRLVCQCQAARCCLGQYIDASGAIRQGVEVAVGTKEAHKRAERILLLPKKQDSRK